MKGHYLMLVLPDGKESVRREFVQLEREDETVEEATERWVQSHPSMVGRQRNRDRTANALRANVIHRSISRPTSWHRQQCEKDGVPFPRPMSRGRRRRGR